MMIKWSVEVQVRVKFQKCSKLDIGGRETCLHSTVSIEATSLGIKELSRYLRQQSWPYKCNIFFEASSSLSAFKQTYKRTQIPFPCDMILIVSNALKQASFYAVHRTEPVYKCTIVCTALQRSQSGSSLPPDQTHPTSKYSLVTDCPSFQNSSL